MKSRLKLNRKHIKIAGIIILILALPLTLILVKTAQDQRSSAAAPDKLETETGVLSSSGVTKQTDSGASGGSYILFNQSTGPSPSPIAGTVYNVPSSIDATGATFVNVELNNWINSLPNGTATNPTIVIFPSNAIYKLADGGRINITNKSYIYFYGMDPSLAVDPVNENTPRTTILNTGDGSGGSDSAFGIACCGSQSNNIKIIGFRIIGSNPNGGTINAYKSTQQSGFGISLYSGPGSYNAEIAYNVITDQWGHAVYVRVDQKPEWDNVNIHHNIVRRTGVMGIVINDGTNIKVDDNKIYDIAMYSIQVEDSTYPLVLNNVSIQRNYIDSWGWSYEWCCPYAINNSADISSSNVIIADNTFVGGDRYIYNANENKYYGIIQWMPERASSNVNVSGNVSNWPKDGIQMLFANINGLNINNNSFIGESGGNADDIFKTQNCTNVTDSNNILR